MDNLPATIEEELPHEIMELTEAMESAIAAKKRAHAEALGRYVAECRDEAVKGRKLSGIEAIWEEDDEYYQGIDEANRNTHTWLKAPGATGGLTANKSTHTNRCTSFFNITRQFVESAAARMGDILLPAGDWNFSVKPTPVQDDEGLSQIIPGEMGQPTPPPLPTANPLQVEAEKRAEKSELWIKDKLVECSYHSEARKVIEYAARLGTGIIKGPFPYKTISRRAAKTETG